MNRARARIRMAIVAAVGAALASACALIQPETGEILPACSDADSNPNEPVGFKERIRPLLDNVVVGTKGCVTCHSSVTGTRAGLDATGFDVATLGLLRRGGRATGTNIVVPGKPCSSIIVQKVRGTAVGPRMPKDGPFWNEPEIRLLMDWIAEGAKGEDAE